MSALQIGITIKDYQDITPHQLSLSQKAYVKSKELEAEEYHIKHKQEQDLLTYQAFMISRWVWQKKVDIEKFLNFGSRSDQKSNRNMTAEDMLRVVKELTKELGGEIIDGTK